MALPQTVPAPPADRARQEPSGAQHRSRPSTDYWDVDQASWRRADEAAAAAIPTPRRGD